MTTSENEPQGHLPHQHKVSEREVAEDAERRGGSSNQEDAGDRQAGMGGLYSSRSARTQSARSSRASLARFANNNSVYLEKGIHYPQLGSSRSQGSATARSKSSIFTNASSRMSLSTQPSGREVTPGGGVIGRRHQHHHHIKKMQNEHKLSITGHVRNENIADAVAKGAHAAEERLRQFRLESGTDHIDHGDTSHAMPRPSYKYGCQLKSQWMDPDNNPIPPSKTYTEYKEKLRTMNLPHISYDIDGDGIVGPEDLFMAKRFDIDNNGVLDEEEQHIGKQIIAEQVSGPH